MSGQLCVGRDPEWWTPDHEQARLAIAICRRCTGCPDNDPEPAGVIRQGVAYSDTGTVVPICPSCGRPNASYRGGVATNRCRACRVPDVPILGVRAIRNRRVATLARRGLTDEAIAAEVGVTPESVGRIRRASGYRHPRGPAPKTSRSVLQKEAV